MDKKLETLIESAISFIHAEGAHSNYTGQRDYKKLRESLNPVIEYLQNPRYLTPAQWEAEHGEPLRDDAVVWCRWNINNTRWYSDVWGEVKHLEDDIYRNADIVVSNGSPYPPPDDWKEAGL